MLGRRPQTGRTRQHDHHHRQTVQQLTQHFRIDPDLAKQAHLQRLDHVTQDFRQRRPDGNGGWKWNLEGVTHVPYMLADLTRAVAEGKRVFICEGEKDVIALHALGLDATCNSGGAGKWPSGFSKYFKGANVVILPDNDDAGRKHAETVAQSLMGVAQSVKILALPGLPPKGDVSDWIADGGFADALELLADKAPGIGTLEADDIDMPVEFSEDSLARAFTAIHADAFRFVSAWGKWFKWTGTHWAEEKTLEVFDLVRVVCREAANRAESPKVASILSKASTIAAVERLARADRQHAATTDQWDSDPWLLNTPGGVVDLRDGRMTRHQPDLHLTKITAVAPGGDCPTWLSFLLRVMNGDAELVAFLQRVAGYSLTGSTRDHALFFAYGTGGNGKGVFINSLVGCIGDYATVSPMETFTASNSSGHPTDLAMLRGARLVTSQETEEGRRWAESKIKSLTGGDPITARFMRQDFFTFTPQFKLVIAGNHKPGLRAVDEAIRRRFHLIPFTVTIPTSERDPALPEKLKAEWPGILKWAIDGCLEWQRIGLAPPKAVVDATDEYLEAEDFMQTWMSECLVEDGWSHETTADLYASFKACAEKAGEEIGSQKAFSQAFETKATGAVKKREGGSGKRGYVGYRIIRTNYAEDPRYGS